MGTQKNRLIEICSFEHPKHILKVMGKKMFSILRTNECCCYITGKSLVYDLLHDFLFPASKLMMDSMNEENTDLLLSEFNPK